MIGIFGASGLVGNNLYRFLKQNQKETLGTYFSNRILDGLIRLDICDGDYTVFDNCSSVVVAGGITNIDQCFTDKEYSYKVNVEKTISLINYLVDKKIRPIFLSSDQVFDGEKGNYREDDNKNPVNHYGYCKVCVEEYMRDNIEDYLILRLSKVFSSACDEKSMFSEIYDKFKNNEPIKAAYNQIYNPTDIVTIYKGIEKAIKNDFKGLYHLADGNIMSRYDFAVVIANKFGFKVDLVERIDFRGLPVIEKRALNSSLNVEKIMNAFQ